MNIQDWGAVGEIIGAVAVIISLLYLALQIRIQNRETRLSTINSSLAEWNSLLALVADNPALAGIWNRGLKNEQLTEGEEVRFRAFTNSYLRVVEGLYLQHREGRLDDRIWQGIGKGTGDMLAAKGLHRFWEHRKDWYSLEFREYVEKAIVAQEATSETLYRHDAQQGDEADRFICHFLCLRKEIVRQRLPFIAALGVIDTSPSNDPR